MTQPVQRNALVGLLLAGWLLLPGCSQGARSLSLDRQLARDSVGVVLDTWQQGTPASALKERSPAIISSDEDRDAGRQLVSYELATADRDDGTNLHLRAALVLKDATGRELRRDVTYIVGTSPVITVFREE